MTGFYLCIPALHIAIKLQPVDNTSLPEDEGWNRVLSQKRLHLPSRCAEVLGRILNTQQARNYECWQNAPCCRVSVTEACFGCSALSTCDTSSCQFLYLWTRTQVIWIWPGGIVF
jgi:hypothetical protein